MAQRTDALDLEFRQALELVTRVLQLQAGVTLAIRLAAAGLALDCLALISTRVFPYRLPQPALVALPIVLAMLGILWTALRPPSPHQVARAVDRQLRLKERVLTALETRGVDRTLARYQLHDTVEHLRRIEPLEAFPVRPPRWASHLVVIFSVLALGLYFAPNPMERYLEQQELARNVIKQQAERIAELAEELAREEPEPPPELAAAEAALQEAARRLSQQGRSPEEALAALAALEQRLLGLQASRNRDAEEALTALMNSLAGTEQGRELAADLARGDYRSAAERLRQMGRSAGEMSESERRALARALRNAGMAAGRADPTLGQSLQRGAESLERGEGADAMESAAERLAEAGAQARTQSALERALSQIQRSRSAISRSQGRQGDARSAQSSGTSPGGRDLTNLDGDRPGPGRGGPEEIGEQPGGSMAGRGTVARADPVFDPIFAPSRPEQVPSGQPFEPTEVQDDPSVKGPYRNEAQVPYSDVYAQYEERATRALQGSYIPSGLKDLVKEYFSSIAPK